MMVGPSGHGREVSDREDLLLLADFSQALPDLLSNLTTQSGVDLVKDRDHVVVNSLE